MYYLYDFNYVGSICVISLMKKIIIGIIVIIVVFLLAIVIINFKDKDINNNEEINVNNFVEDKKEYIDIDYNTLSNMVGNKETFIVVFTITGCSHCRDYEPIVYEVINNNNINIYRLNYTDLSDEDKTSIVNMTGLKSTPTTIFYRNGIEIDRCVGFVSKEKLEEKLRNNNFI